MLWYDDARERGISFGRSKLSHIVKTDKSTNHLELTLTQLSAVNNIWNGTLNECLFLNTTYSDFRPPKKSINLDENVNKMIQIYNNVESTNNIFDCIDFDQIIAEPDTSIEQRDFYQEQDFLSFSFDSLFNNISIFPSTTLNFNLITDKNYEKEYHAYSFMIEKIFPNCICYGGDFRSNRNPYLNYLVPLSYSSSILFKALVSYSAKIYSIFHDKEFERISIKYKDEVLKDLPELIKFKQSSNSNDWEEIFGTILILCSSNISSDCDIQWIIHSQGGKKLLNAVTVGDLDPFKKFYIRYLTSHEIMRETITSSDEDSLLMTYESFKNDYDNEIDLMLGCSPNLLRIVSEITKLGEYYESLEQESRSNKAILEELIITKKNSLINQLKSLSQTMRDEVPCIQMIAEIKRLTAMVYLFARIDLLELKFNGQQGLDKKLYLLNILIKDIMGKINLIDYCTMSLLWPLFMVGLTGLNLDDSTRWIILHKFKEMENMRHLASVKMARSTVEHIWKYRDFNDSELLTWKELVALNNDTISLA